MHVILLDRFIGQWGDDNYAVSFAGTLMECRQQTHHGAMTYPEPRAGRTEGHQEPKSLIDPTGSVDAGRIVELLGGP